MRRPVSIALISFLAASFIFAQKTDDRSFRPIPAVSEKSAEQIVYSESKPYQPRQFPGQNNKTQKEKKPDKNDPFGKGRQPDNDNSSPAAAETNKVLNIPVTVFDKKGMAVTDLKETDFTLFVDGKETPVSSFAGAGGEPLNIFLVLDTSPSISFQTKEIRHFVSEFIASLKAEDKIQLIRFDQKAAVLTPLTNDQQILKKGIGKIDFGDGTSLYETIHWLSKKHVSSVEGRKIILLLTDGVDTVSKVRHETSLVEAEKNDAVVYPFYLNTFSLMSGAAVKKQNPALMPILGQVLGIKPTDPAALSEAYEHGRHYLNELAALSGGRTFEIKELSKVKAADFEKTAGLFKPHYYLGLNTTEFASSPGRKAVKVRINRPDLVVRARGSFIIGK